MGHRRGEGVAITTVGRAAPLGVPALGAGDQNGVEGFWEKRRYADPKVPPVENHMVPTPSPHPCTQQSCSAEAPGGGPPPGPHLFLPRRGRLDKPPLGWASPEEGTEDAFKGKFSKRRLWQKFPEQCPRCRGGAPETTGVCCWRLREVDLLASCWVPPDPSPPEGCPSTGPLEHLSHT